MVVDIAHKSLSCYNLSVSYHAVGLWQSGKSFALIITEVKHCHSLTDL